MDEPFTHARFEAALDQASLGVDASELHGLLTGYLCGGGHADGRHVLEALELESDDGADDGPLAELLDAAAPWCRERLDGLHLGFEPLLPAEARPLAERADAMVEWTRGFLGGFGLADTDAAALSGDGREVLHDLGTIAASPLTLDASSESAVDDDESALMELVEFVRVGAMLLRTEVVSATQPPGGRAS